MNKRIVIELAKDENGKAEFLIWEVDENGDREAVYGDERIDELSIDCRFVLNPEQFITE